MIFFEVFDREMGIPIVTTIDDCSENLLFEGKEKENVTINGFRNVFREFDKYEVRIIGPANEDLFQTATISTRSAKALLAIIPFLNKFLSDQEQGYRILFHNLVTTHAMMQDEIEFILPAETLSHANNHEEQISLAKEAINKPNDEVAGSILQLSKRIIDLQAQIEGFKMLKSDVRPDYASHNIKKVLLNIVYPFFEQFGPVNIFVKINIDDETAEANRVKIDYKLFNVVMHHFFNNAVKYAQPYSNINISYLPETSTLKISMRSLRIDKDERERIFKLRAKGRHSEGLSGEGIGMYMVGKALEIMGTRMEVNSDLSSQEITNGFPYTNNTFSIAFR